MDFDYLYIYISDNELKENYTSFVDSHNNQVNTLFPNAGFDILSPFEIKVSNEETKFVLDTQIICCMKSYDNKNLGYYLYPSSINQV